MYSIATIRNHLAKGGFDKDFCDIHSSSRCKESNNRLTKLLDLMEKSFNPEYSQIASAPGRTELGGNHTDHNHGRVLAAAVNLDCLSIFSPASGPNEQTVTILSENFEHPIVADLSDTTPRPEEEGTSESIVRGVADGFRKTGFKASGFNACISSTIPSGAGLSSSAAFEVLVGRIFSALFNNSMVDPLDIARIAKRAENLYFGKPCGFMDQMASSFEGILGIDFEDPDNPIVERVSPGFTNTENSSDGFYGTGYRLCVIDTGGSHADLTPEYASIPQEILKAAQFFGRTAARGITISEVMEHIGPLRETVGDRATLRLLHFIGEDERAVQQVKSLQAGNMKEYMMQVAESGHSSSNFLQNCYNTHAPSEQPIPLALAVTEMLLGSNGVSRVHGGGFAGTIQAYVHESHFEKYRDAMDKLFGAGAVIELVVRQPGREIIWPS